MDIGQAKTPEELSQTLHLLHTEVDHQNELVIAEAGSVDAKATATGGFAATFELFLLSQQPGGWARTIAAITLACSMGLALACIWPRRWHKIITTELTDTYGSASPLVAIGRLVATKTQQTEKNRKLAKPKFYLWSVCAASAVFGTVIGGLSIVTG
jgi:hypothetical protein